MPDISFVLPAYKKKWLNQAIDSILGQTFTNLELIIVDDCSPENLEETVSHYHDSRISFHRNPENIGGRNLVNQWNHCIGYAKGDWIVMAADDDIYQPEFASEIMRLADRYQGVSLIRSRVEQIDENGNHIWDDGIFPEFSSPYLFLHDWLTAKAFTCIGNYAFKREKLLGMGGFINFPSAYNSDVATPIALSESGVGNTQEMLFKFRQSSLHLSGNPARYKDQLEATSQFYEWLDNFSLPSPKSYKDQDCYSIKNKEYLHKKCIYDYFNLVIRYLPLCDLPQYLKHCRLAGTQEKVIMMLRWLKRKIYG